MGNRKKEILVVIVVLIIQTVLYVICGINKSYIHMDEAYSLGLASYDKVEIQNNEDFYNTWHSKEYYEDYLSLQESERNNYGQVYENQKNDVHPPLYYLLLRFAMNFTPEHFSKWAGIAINIVIYLLITIVTYNILKKLLSGQSKSKEKAILLAFVSSITMASLTNVIYIRMYALSTLNILITTYLHMKLLKKEKTDISLLTCIGLSALAGSLTHYYYLFYLAIMYIFFAIKYSKEKNYKKLVFYTMTLAIAGLVSLAIFPYSIQHMFFGYRGQGVLSNLTNIPEFMINIFVYLWKANYYGFNNLLWVILILIGIILHKKIKNKTTIIMENNDYIKILALPTLFYFIVVAIASPWKELRYILPICTLLFILVIYYLYQFLKIIWNEKKCNVFISFLLLAIVISPILFRIEPEVLYSDKKQIVKQLENELNLPTIYLLNSQNNRFLDDILLFSKLENSYITKDMDITAENIKTILTKKEISNGIVLFLNEGQDNHKILQTVSDATSLQNWKHLKRLNACDVYYFYDIISLK